MDTARSLTGARWTHAPLDPARLAAFAHADLLGVTARCMALRGFDPSSGWLTPSLDHLHAPEAMLGMDRALDRLRHAVREGQRIRVVTDYDVDGTTSSLILQAALARVAPHLSLDHHIPDRFTEGYGFSVRAAEQAAADGIGLLVTADIGVRDHAAVNAARARGVDVLVCDHHLPAGAAVPDQAIVLCPPQAGDTYPNRALAACGVSLKLADGLLADPTIGVPDEAKRAAFRTSLLKLAAIGTVADLVPIDTLENRAIVTLGLAALNRGGHGPGLSALLDVANLKVGELDETSIGWQIAPRINAAGRIAHATHVIELLTCRDPARARVLALELDALNRERRDVQGALVDQVLATLREPYDPFVVVAGPEADGWHRGVVGIVASKLKDVVHRPVAVVSIQGELAVGSVRSVPSVHAVRALDAAADLLLKYGGHPMAAGFTVRAADLDRLRQRLSAFVEANTETDALLPEHVIDADVSPADLGGRLVRELRRLGPFGSGNPEPRLCLPGVRLEELRTMGKDGQHLKAKVVGHRSAEVVWWGGAPFADALRAGPVDLLGTVRDNVWNGWSRTQLTVIDARRSA